MKSLSQKTCSILLIALDLPFRVLNLTLAFQRKSCYKTAKALKYYLLWTM